MKHNHSEEKRSKISDSEIQDNAFDRVNKYGTYNIQPTNASDNTFPAISQGLDKKTAERLEKESERWKKENVSKPRKSGN